MNKKLPILISVPHAGETIPPEVADRCILTPEQIMADSDGGASEIYALEDLVECFMTTHIARAITDLNRAPDDRRGDGVVKTHTCNLEAVYSTFPDAGTVQLLLDRYYHPYHQELTSLANSGIVLGVDCHTMAAIGPPVGPDPGGERPRICISNGDGTCPDDWFESLGDCLAEIFDGSVRLNSPFTGGYITRRHAPEMPWVQLELSRAPFMSNSDKRSGVLESLRRWLSIITG
ncbi:N-formylglutamate amidohydrolase [Desulfonema ishimotonii]|uniref:N-formylglutamate amidohydrolase n=1 Tax=Desulfonema ishimotonii TaxID=45657 RepID=A0A401FXV8_9BACT|nr:N-formylglutamate amidohydrolase [Desulfonema ishimotonii]GBC61842.1 N-formylglutamate amidohydrolase [Desulfonema ishimotonii]